MHMGKTMTLEAFVLCHGRNVVGCMGGLGPLAGRDIVQAKHALLQLPEIQKNKHLNLQDVKVKNGKKKPKKKLCWKKKKL